MIKYIRGTYAMTFESGIVVETASGIGFAVHVPAGSPLYRSREGEEVMVYTLMIVKEDDISLYGFHNKESLELFRMLITVNGVGAKAAMSRPGTMTVTSGAGTRRVYGGGAGAAMKCVIPCRSA